jgi:hypothetical protein
MIPHRKFKFIDTCIEEKLTPSVQIHFYLCDSHENDLWRVTKISSGCMPMTLDGSLTITAALLISAVTFLMGVYNFLNGRQREAASDATNMVKQLQAIKEDCTKKSQEIEVKLATIESKYNTMFDVILTKFPKLLVSPHTAQLDGLIWKGLNGGWECLSIAETELLNELIEKEITVLELQTVKVGSSHDLKLEAKISAFAMIRTAIAEKRRERKC